jgi:putative endonuclease
MATDGYLYERRTADWFGAQGLRLLARNYRCRGGELDLVLLEGSTLVFVEVRVRSNLRFAGAAASVDWRKQRRLRHAALLYLQREWRGGTPPCRFDLVVWEPAPDSGKLRPRWIRSAFAAP